MTETKEEFLAREEAWLAALPGCPPVQQQRIVAWLNVGRGAYGLKPVHKIE